MLNTTKTTAKTARTHTGHESLLNHFARSGKTVSVVLISGKEYVGRVKAFDRYTISLELKSDSDEAITVVIFKHAVQFFYSTEK